MDVMVRSFDGTVLAHFSLASAEQLLRLRDAVRPYGCSAIHMDASSCDFALDRRAANHREQHPGRRAADKKRTLPEHR
ncbi:hypothetical protein Rta_14250 [Ramlibacter tataouinensis TTB310]|uniref:Uncharacterized protein n=1 Tax=Ramlibacter tataouinensis (strain ATCC BAA-407 / DSM 14655 / LMG 21543 / TTB310) TaxID=365046 RepID=F5Y447_RAMTT|nr:hypothetical protein Rta_14250 [Ramlibacter tataouinensis TTB310]